jgi:hypothetical protein
MDNTTKTQLLPNDFILQEEVMKILFIKKTTLNKLRNRDKDNIITYSIVGTDGTKVMCFSKSQILSLIKKIE